MKECSIEGCNRPHRAKGFCGMHYYRFFKCKIQDRSPQPLENRTGKNHLKCSVESCDEKQHSLGYCRLHHAAYKRNGPGLHQKPHKCAAPNCDTSVKQPRTVYCCFHLMRLQNGKSLIRPKGHARGKEVWNWKGGIAEYPDHSILKSNRLYVLRESDDKCFLCGSIAKVTHHLDLSKDNHSRDNLLPLCFSCHQHIHHGNVSLLLSA
jgi:hypothetical protein